LKTGTLLLFHINLLPSFFVFVNKEKPFFVCLFFLESLLSFFFIFSVFTFFLGEINKEILFTATKRFFSILIFQKSKRKKTLSLKKN